MGSSVAQMMKLSNFGLQIFNKYNLLLVIQHLYFQSNQLVLVSTFRVERTDVLKFGKITFANKQFNSLHLFGSWLMTVKAVTLLLGVQTDSWESLQEIIQKEPLNLNWKHSIKKSFNRHQKNQVWANKT